MKKLSKSHEKDLADLVNRLEIASKELTDAMEGALNKVQDYNEILAEAREFRDDRVGEMEDYISERSEKWSETEAASNYDSWKSEWENLELDDLEEPEIFDNLSHRDDLENVPNSPD